MPQHAFYIGRQWNIELDQRVKVSNAVTPYSAKTSPHYAVRPEGARHQWRKIPPRELSIDLVADERLGWATGRVEAS